MQDRLVNQMSYAQGSSFHLNRTTYKQNYVMLEEARKRTRFSSKKH